MPMDVLDHLCKTMKTERDDKLERLINSLASEGATRVEVGRAGDRGGVDVYIEPTEAARPPSRTPPAAPDAPPSSQAN